MSKFLHSLDNFRGIAILLVVLTHLRTAEGDLTDGSATAWLRFLITGATFYFVFISGYLFWHLESSRFDYRALLWRKLRFVVLPYLCVALPVVLARAVNGWPARLYDMSPAGYVAWALVTGAPAIGPLWYVPMILLVFVASPLWYRVLASPRGIVVVLALMAISMFSGRPYLNMNPVLGAVHFCGVFLLGGFVARHREAYRAWLTPPKAVALVAAGMAVFALAGTMEVGVGRPAHSLFAERWLQPNFGELARLGLLVALLAACEMWLNRRVGWLSQLANRSFAVFFLHGLVIDQLLPRTGVSDLIGDWAPALGMVAEFTLVMAACLVAIEIARRMLPRGSRYVIGA